MNDAVKEVMNLLPSLTIERASKISEAFAPDTGFIATSKVLSVQRAQTTSFSTGQVYQCRQIPHTLSQKASDVNSIEYATDTDPVYYIEPQLNNTAAKIKILPSSTSNVAKVISIDYPLFDADGTSDTYLNVTTVTSIPNFPDEAEYLVVLRASIYAIEYMMMSDEETEVKSELWTALNKDYRNGIDALQTGKFYRPKTKATTAVEGV